MEYLWKKINMDIFPSFFLINLNQKTYGKNPELREKSNYKYIHESELVCAARILSF